MSAAPAAAQFKDTICPQAAQYVSAIGKLHSGDPPDKIYAASQAAANAYEECSKEKLSNGYREAQHYADTRGASFAVLAARALISMNRFDEARHELQKWRPLAQQVVDWRSETMAFASADASGSSSTINGDHRASVYAESAKEVVAAIDTELAKIDQHARDVARPQQQASPSPH